MGTEPIRILRVIARLNVGGPALHVSYLSAGLDEYGYETTLVAGRIGSGEGSMDEQALALGVRPVYVDMLQRDIDPRADIVSTRELRRLIRDVRPHILHTHTAKAGTVGRLAARLAGRDRPKAVVHTFHGHVLRGYFNPLVTEGFRRVEGMLSRSSDALIAVSPQIRDELVALGVAPPGRISVIRLGLDLDARTRAARGAREALREELQIPNGSVVVGWLGRMTAIKRVDDLLRGFAGARTEAATLVLVGDGPDRPALERLAGELGILDRCRFTGYRDDVAAFYAAADVIGLTSANEGTPVSLIEAMAAGKPVFSTDVGGVRDVVADGSSGLLVPAADVEAIADVITSLVEDAGLRSALGASAGASVRNRYSVSRLLGDVDRLYRSLLDGAAPRPVIGRTRPLAPTLEPATLARAGRAARPLRIALLSQYFSPEVGATQTRMQSFAEYLAARGHEVTVICEVPNHPHGVIPDEYRGTIVEDDRSNPYRVLRVWVAASAEKTQLTRMELYLSYMGMATVAATRLGPVDVVLATTPPLFAAAAGLAIARAKRAPFVLDVRDLWPAAAVSLGQLSNRLALSASEWLERTLYREAAAVVAVTRPFCEAIDELRGRPPRTALIPNGTLERFFAPRDRAARAELGIPEDRYLVTFAGTIGIAQSLPRVLDAASLADDVVAFAFIGDGPARQLLVDDALARGLRNISFHDQRPLEAIAPLLGASDALLVTLSAHPTFADFVPSKLIDFMATGRPVLVAAAGEPARIVDAVGGGLSVPPEDPEALVAAIHRLLEDPAAAEEMGRRGRAWARRRLRSVQAERLERVLEEAVARRTRNAGETVS